MAYGKYNYLSDCPNYLKDFIFYLETIVNRSDKTIYEYYIDVRTFMRFLKLSREMVPNETAYEDIKISDISLELINSVTLSDVYEYMHFIYTERLNSSPTRARKVSSLRAFYRYLSTKSKYTVENPLLNLEIPAIKKTLPKHLSLEESMDMLEAVDGRNKERDYCILTLFLNCGLRLGELVGVDMQDIRKDSLKVLGKGNKERIIYLNEACVEAIKEYSSVRPQDAHQRDAFFISQHGTRLCRRRVQQIVEHCLDAIGLRGMGYSTHKLRHTAATLMFQYGNVDIRVLKEILGHENITTTEIYTHVSNRQMEEAANKSPLSQVKRRIREADKAAENK
jgi:site-specific recombinase XerD